MTCLGGQALFLVVQSHVCCTCQHVPGVTYIRHQSLMLPTRCRRWQVFLCAHARQDTAAGARHCVLLGMGCSSAYQCPTQPCDEHVTARYWDTMLNLQEGLDELCIPPCL